MVTSLFSLVDSLLGAKASRHKSTNHDMDSRLVRDVDRHGKKLFQIVGVPRSGTTLLTERLGCHPSIMTLREPFLSWRRRQTIEVPDKRDKVAGLAPHLLIESLCKSIPQSHLGFKETFRTEHYWPDRATESFLQQNVEIDAVDFTLVIVRNPLAIWRSVREGRKARMRRPGEMVNTRFTQNWNALATWIRSANLFYVRYEDLVLNPDKYFQEITSLLGLQFSPEMITTGQKHSTLATGDIFSSSINQYQQELSSKETEFILQSCGEMMRSLGYLNE